MGIILNKTKTLSQFDEQKIQEFCATKGFINQWKEKLKTSRRFGNVYKKGLVYSEM